MERSLSNRVILLRSPQLRKEPVVRIHQGKGAPSQSLYSVVLDPPWPSSIGPAKVLGDLNVYLKEPVVDMEVPKDALRPEGEMVTTKPLQSWKANRPRFSVLSGTARDAFSVAASSGSIRRSLSTATDILDAKRTNSFVISCL